LGHFRILNISQGYDDDTIIAVNQIKWHVQDVLDTHPDFAAHPAPNGLSEAEVGVI
jgi:hypothetical protein